MKKVLIGLIAVFAGLTASFAQVPSEIPLTPEKFERWALGKINRVSGGVAGQSLSGNNRYYSAEYPSDGNTTNIAAAAKRESAKLAFESDPAEMLEIFSSWDIRMPDGNTWSPFFGGSKPFKPVKDPSGAYKIPTEALTVPLRFGSAPFPFPGAVSGYMIIRDSAGNQIDYINLGGNEKGGGTISNGYIIISDFFFFRNGELYVQTGDGKQHIYALTGGIRRETVTVTTSTGIDTSVEGHRSLPDNTVSIVYTATDKSLMVKYTVGTTVTIAVGPAPLPTKITVVEKSAFDSKPVTGGTSFNAKDPITFAAQAGQTFLIFLERLPVKS